jgi:superfamily II RNA helicase
MHFKNFTLDTFQEEAIHAIEHHHSVVVSAATGTGKTLIADYVIDKYLKTHKRIIYTAPIKALSNQKFKDFKHSYGSENVGILTGDIVINPQAPILIMTTEIYRNMLLTRDPLINDVEYVIFDEIHYMNDPERGTVWEEAIIFSPPHMRFLCLSATVPNAVEFASWIQTIKSHPVEVVRYAKRAVPLQHSVFESIIGLTTAKNLADHMNMLKHGNASDKRYSGRQRRRRDDYYVASPRDVILRIRDKLPAIVFSFSRKACETEALKLVEQSNFATSDDEHHHIAEICREYFTPEINHLQSTAKLREVLIKGVGFHHAGLLPQHKAVVEELFSHGLLKVLFATETFSVGINMPAKTVIFNGLRKFDGLSFRVINSKEYFQLAGRAGRRGIDTAGYVVAIIDRTKDNINEFITISSADTEPIRSRFKLSFNTVLNLLAQYDEQEIDRLLKSNFDYHIRRQKSKRQIRIKASFNNKRRLLQKIGYVTQNGNLTDKGLFAQFIYFKELLISELFTTNIYEQLSDTELLQVIAGIIYEQRQNDHFSFSGINYNYKTLLKKLQTNPFIMKKINKLSLKRMMALVGTWSEDAAFEDLLQLTNRGEGDVIRLFRRIIDTIGQVKRATNDYKLQDRLAACQQRIDRDLVAVKI